MQEKFVIIKGTANFRPRVLVEVRQDRRLFAQTQSLYEVLAQQPIKRTYSVEVLADARIKGVARSL